MLKILLVLNLVFIHLAFADVYPDTVHQRRELTTEEKQHLLHLGKLGQSGCSASALTPDTILTAEHCFPRYLNGASDRSLINGYLESNPSHTFKIISVLDASSHYSNDVLVLKIKWTSGKAPADLKYTREIVIHESDLKFGADSEATSLFTIGYPKDRDRQATHSTGFLKDTDLIPGAVAMKDPYTLKPLADALYLKVNVPMTHGNSGGAVFTGNYKLVGTVHGGSTALESEKNSAEFNSQGSRFWNRIAALYYVYPQMKSLQKIFPNGINPNVGENGEWIGK
jgi:V8-like Glu-specific endopeptidase